MGRYPEAIAEVDKYVAKYPDNYIGYPLVELNFLSIYNEKVAHVADV